MTVTELEVLQPMIEGKQITVVTRRKRRHMFQSEITIIVDKVEIDKYVSRDKLWQMEKTRNVGFICYTKWKQLRNEKFFIQESATCINVKEIYKIKDIKDVAV